LPLFLLCVCLLGFVLPAGCSSKETIGREEFDSLGNRVVRLEDRVFPKHQDPAAPGVAPGGVPGPAGFPVAPGSPGPAAASDQFPPGGAIAPLDPAFLDVFGPAPPAAAPGASSSAPAGPKPSASERTRYNRAQSLLKSKQYAKAAMAFSEMLRDFPGGALAPNARYWLGECRYAAGDFSGALAEFRQGLQDYPQSNKAPDYLLKMSYCQSQLGDGPGAMQSLRQLLASYPDSDSAKMVKSGRSRFVGSI
jgi:tol-pal system protein YbgF